MSAKSKRKFVNDILLCVAILVIALITFLFFKATVKDGSFAVVLVDGEEKYRYSLSENGEYLIQNGDFENLLVVKDGKAFVSSANCRDKICVSHIAVSNTGESIVCLPHKLVVSIEAKED